MFFLTQASVEQRVEEDLLQWHLTMDMFRFRMEITSQGRMVCVDKYSGVEFCLGLFLSRLLVEGLVFFDFVWYTFWVYSRVINTDHEGCSMFSTGFVQSSLSVVRIFSPGKRSKTAWPTNAGGQGCVSSRR